MKKLFVLLILSLPQFLFAQNWVKVPSNVTWPIYEIDFFNDSIGTCYGALSTTDKGKSWYKDSVIVEGFNNHKAVGRFQIINDSVCVGMINVQDTNTSKIKVYFCRSNDKGKIWSATPLPTLFQDDRLTLLHFYDENYGVAMGGRNAFPNINIDGAYTFTTRDGGNTWDTVVAYYGDSKFNGYPYSVWMTDTNMIWATGHRYWELQPNYHFVKASCDGGYIWTCGGGPSLTYTNGNGPGFGSLYFINKQLGFVSGDSALWRTTDGVSFKRHINQPVAATHFDKTGKYGAAIYSVDYDAPNGNINNRRYLLRTSDSGETWGRQEIEGATSNINKVYVLDSLVTILVGDNGLILRTETGGGPVTPLTIVSVDDEKSELLKETILYPNPATDELIIESNLIGEYRIVNTLGQEVRRGFKSNEKIRIDISGLPAGVYFLKNESEIHIFTVVR